jgi:hypothetical protein
MVSKGRAKERARHLDLARKPARREPRKRLLILCEGVETEPRYFEALRQKLRTQLIEVRILGAGADPRTVVLRGIELRKEAEAEADRLRDSNQLWDEIWCVVDVDDHKTLKTAKEHAEREGIHLAISNPSFELWALLHFEDHRRSEHRSAIRAKLKKHLPKYKKTLPFEEMDSRVAEAIERSVALCAWQKTRKTHGENPSTHVHVLVRRVYGDMASNCSS